MYSDYPEQAKSVGIGLATMQESNRQRLEREKAHLLNRVSDIDRALALFDQHPEMEELTDLLRRI